jgi:hypothetical protein
MQSRSKVFAIESISVMLVLILFAFVIVMLISSGSHAYNHILGDKKATESARVAYSYVNMKVRQNDIAGGIDVVDTAYGNALKIDVEGGSYCTYIFFADGNLYECLTIQGVGPSVDAGNLITKMRSFDIERDGAMLNLRCTSGSGDEYESMEGVVSLRT